MGFWDSSLAVSCFSRSRLERLLGREFDGEVSSEDEEDDIRESMFVELRPQSRNPTLENVSIQ
jgi:hypothetical protein